VVNLGMVQKLEDGIERDYQSSRIEEERDSFADQAVFVLAAFLAALREGEAFKLVLCEARTYFAEARRNTKLPHVVLLFRGRFKG